MKQAKLILILSALLVVILVGCREEDFFLRYSHFRHVEENDLECTFCHGELSDEGFFSRPDHEICINCHEELIEADEITADTCGTCHVEKDLDEVGASIGKPRPTVGVFRHSDDLAGSCRDCHGAMIQEEIEHVANWSREDVVDLRQAGLVSGRPCIDCHDYLEERKAPASHQKNWIRRHGVFAGDEDTMCGFCHKVEQCNECHIQERPSWHNNLWRLKTHGIEANWNREQCMVCHQDDFCSSCHSDTKPRSHTGSWQDRHCGSCHSAADAGAGCEVCHEGGIEVHLDLAPPAFHENFSSRRDCFDCHSDLDPREHVFFDSDQCTFCHQI